MCLALLPTLYLQPLWHDWNSSKVVSDGVSFFPFILYSVSPKCIRKHVKLRCVFSAGDMQSHELVVKQNSVSQTSKVQRVKLKEGRGVYTECPWQTGWNPRSSRTTSGPLDSSRVQGPLRRCSSVSLPHALHSGCAGTCWFHLLTTTVVKLLSFIRPLIPQSPWPLYALDHYKMYKEKDWGGDERKEEEEGTTPPAWE